MSHIHTTIASVLTKVGLKFDHEALVQIEQGIQDDLNAHSLGKVIAHAVHKKNFSYRRVAECIYNELERKNDHE